MVIRYGHSDEARQTIPWVESIVNGKRTVYKTADAKEDGAGLQMREMDCMDCHNRPSHALRSAGPGARPGHGERRDLAGAALGEEEGSRDAEGQLHVARGGREQDSRRRSSLSTSESHPAVYAQHAAEVKAAAKEVLAIWKRNIFPDMKVTWGKYPINIGHNDFPGCFRCHDGAHTATDGRSITQDCNACHNLLSMEEEIRRSLPTSG